MILPGCACDELKLPAVVGCPCWKAPFASFLCLKVEPLLLTVLTTFSRGGTPCFWRWPTERNGQGPCMWLLKWWRMRPATTRWILAVIQSPKILLASDGQWPNPVDATKDRCIGAWWTMGSVTVHLASDVWGDIHQGKLEPPKLTNKCWVVDSDFRRISRIPILKHTQSIPIWHRDMISEICFPSLPMTCDLDRLCQPVLQRRRAPSPVAFPSILR